MLQGMGRGEKLVEESYSWLPALPEPRCSEAPEDFNLNFEPLAFLFLARWCCICLQGLLAQGAPGRSGLRLVHVLKPDRAPHLSVGLFTCWSKNLRGFADTEGRTP